MTDNVTYESMLGIVGGLGPPASGRHRRITWCVPGGPLGLCRDRVGRIEIFLVGPPLVARTAAVARHLHHGTWARDDGKPFDASRLVLPPSGHFDQVAAFLCTELIRQGALVDLPGTFLRNEPIMALALEQMALTDAALLGLCGELLVLAALLDRCRSEDRFEVVSGWHGHSVSARDIQLRATGIEVKTTTGESSAHAVQGVHQVEPGHGAGGVDEVQLHLVSVGLEWADDGDTTTLPDLVERVIRSIDGAGGPRSQLSADLVANVRRYGGIDGPGYDHDDPTPLHAHSRPFRVAFTRSYDMVDPLIRVLGSDDLAEHTHVDPGSVRFRVQLPTSVRGDTNPVVGLGASAQQALDRAGMA